MSDEFPFISNASQETVNNLPLFKELAWNFEKDNFIYLDNGMHKILEGNEAIKTWIYKALRTERYSYLVYSWQYGIELEPFIGKVMSVQERYSELKRVIVECLMVNPYILSINKIDFSKDSVKVVCNIDLTTVYGEVNVDV